VDFRQQTSVRLELAVDERRVEDELCRVIGDLHRPPRLNLTFKRLEVPLNPVYAYREGINQVEALVCLASTGVNTPETMFPRPPPESPNFPDADFWPASLGRGEQRSHKRCRKQALPRKGKTA